MWKDIPNYQGYQVSDNGDVRTHNKVTHTDRHGERHWKDRVLTPKVGVSKRNRGDERVDLWKDGKPRTFKVSRLVAFTFLGGDIDDPSITVNHKDGNFRNNNIDNLELVTLVENINHGFDNGLYHSAKPVSVTDKKTGETIAYRSQSEACRAIGKYSSYLSQLFARGEHDDANYYYELF